MITSVKKFIKNRRNVLLFFSIIGICGYTCLQLLHSAFVPKIHEEFSTENLKYLRKEESNTGYYIKEQQAFYDGTVTEERQYTTPELSVPGGTYTITVEYDTNSEFFTCYAYAHDAGTYHNLESDMVTLRPEKHEISFNIRVKHSIHDLQIRVNDPQNGNIDIKKIVIEENGVDTRILLCNTICFIAIVLILYWLAVRYGKGTTSREQIRTLFILGIGWAAASLLLCHDGLMYYEGLDLPFHLWRIEGIKDALLSGQFPVRIHPNTLNGYGYAAPVMYGETLLYIPAIMRVIGYSIEVSYDTFIAMINAGIIAVSYYCMQKMTKDRNISAIGALIYVFSPYYLQAIYVNTSVGEYCSMMFMPLIIYGLWLIYHKEAGEIGKYDYLPLVIGASGIIQSHILTTVFTVIPVLFFCIISWKKTFQKQRLIALGKTGVLTFLLNAWFIVPFLSYYQTDLVVTERKEHIHYIQRQGLTVIQSICAFFNENYSDTLNGTLPKGVGVVLALAIAVFGILWFSVCQARKNETYRIGMWCCLAGGTYVVLSSNIVPYDFLCERVPIVNKMIGMMQFPSRFLVFATVLLTFLWVVNLSIAKTRMKQYYTAIVAVLVIGTVLQAKDFMGNVLMTSEAFSICDEAALNREDIVYMAVGQGEYLPICDDGEHSDLYEMYTDQILWDDSQIVSDISRENNSYKLQCKNRSGETAYIELPLLYYPNYRADDIQGKNMLVCSAGGNGRIRIEVPGDYDGTIYVHYVSPWYWRLAEIISVLCFIYIAENQYLKRRKQKHEKNIATVAL